MIGFVVRYLMVAAIVLLIPNYLKGISVDRVSQSTVRNSLWWITWLRQCEGF